VCARLLDATGQPTTDPPAILRFSTIVGHFSVWGVALVTSAPTVAPQKLGYWKNTPGATQALLPQALGTYVVDTLATANAILQATTCSNNKPNNAVGCLAWHLLAAKLNLASGVSACIQPTVVAATRCCRAPGLCAYRSAVWAPSLFAGGNWMESRREFCLGTSRDSGGQTKE
jgi:hypothetical protein